MTPSFPSRISTAAGLAGRSARRSPAWVVALLLPLLLAFVGCKKKEPETCNPDEKQFTKVRVAVQATEEINLDPEGTPRATSLRIYQLKGGRSLDVPLDFRQVWQDAKSSFGDELLKEEELTIYPGKTEVFEIKPVEEVTHFVATAIFREPVGSAWYAEWETPKFHGDSVCMAEKKKQTYEEPCFLIFMEGSQLDGGHKPPPGMDTKAITIACPPPPLTVKPAPALDPKEEKKKKRKEKREARKAKAKDKAGGAQEKGAEAQDGADSAQGASDKAQGASDTVEKVGNPEAPAAPEAPDAPTAPGKD
jgi:type VI secretion system VasD/TssJ family lipoprotein